MQLSIPPIGQSWTFSTSQVDLTHSDDYVVSKLDEGRVGIHRERWYTEVRLLIFRAHLDQMQRNANPEMAILFTKNQTKGTSTPVTETDFHFKTTS